MLLRKEKSTMRRSQSVKITQKRKSLVKIPSTSKIPKDFFRQPLVDNQSYPDQTVSNSLMFTFMTPFKNLSQSTITQNRDNVKKTNNHKLVKNGRLTNKCLFL